MRNYNDPQYKQWRKDIKKRDNYTCQWPHCTNKTKLHAHHIYKWADFPGLRYHTQNGITLCRLHHDLIKNNEENYSEYFTRILMNKENNK